MKRTVHTLAVEHPQWQDHTIGIGWSPQVRRPSSERRPKHDWTARIARTPASEAAPIKRARARSSCSSRLLTVSSRLALSDTPSNFQFGSACWHWLPLPRRPLGAIHANLMVSRSPPVQRGLDTNRDPHSPLSTRILTGAQLHPVTPARLAAILQQSCSTKRRRPRRVRERCGN